MRSSNPALLSGTFSSQRAQTAGEAMTISGTVYKSLILLFCCLLTSGYTWSLFMASGNPADVQGWMMGGIFGGLIAAFATIFKPQWAPFTAPVYALLEGLFIGGISALLEASFPGIAIQAVSLTFGVFAVMLVAYQTGLIRATEKFKMGVVAATGAVFVVYFLSFILSFFGVAVPFIYESGLFGIGFSLVVVVIAALNLILDFDVIEQGAKRGAPKYMEWYGAFALMVTLVWLYIEILRLLSKLRSNR